MLRLVEVTNEIEVVSVKDPAVVAPKEESEEAPKEDGGEATPSSDFKAYAETLDMSRLVLDGTPTVFVIHPLSGSEERAAKTAAFTGASELDVAAISRLPLEFARRGISEIRNLKEPGDKLTFRKGQGKSLLSAEVVDLPGFAQILDEIGQYVIGLTSPSKTQKHDEGK